MRAASAAFALALAAGCADPLQHQRGVAKLHAAAAAACVAAPPRCAALNSCAAGLRASLERWRATSAAVVAGGDGAAETAEALVSEGLARTACLKAGVR